LAFSHLQPQAEAFLPCQLRPCPIKEFFGIKPEFSKIS